MHSNVKHHECPRCGGLAATAGGTNFTHSAAHGIMHGLQHGNPVMMGLGAVAACVQLFKQVRYYCSSCGHQFFGR